MREDVEDHHIDLIVGGHDRAGYPETHRILYEHVDRPEAGDAEQNALQGDPGVVPPDHAHEDRRGVLGVIAGEALVRILLEQVGRAEGRQKRRV